MELSKRVIGTRFFFSRQDVFLEGAAMQKGIHPKYGKCVVSCSCGNAFETGACVSELKIDICSACHPFYTGNMKVIDAAGRIEKFNKKYNWGKTAAKAAEKTPEMTPEKAQG